MLIYFERFPPDHHVWYPCLVRVQLGRFVFIGYDVTAVYIHRRKPTCHKSSSLFDVSSSVRKQILRETQAVGIPGPGMANGHPFVAVRMSRCKTRISTQSFFCIATGGEVTVEYCCRQSQWFPKTLSTHPRLISINEVKSPGSVHADFSAWLLNV